VLRDVACMQARRRGEDALRQGEKALVEGELEEAQVHLRGRRRLIH
jgi:hypothetical protein